VLSVAASPAVAQTAALPKQQAASAPEEIIRHRAQARRIYHENAIDHVRWLRKADSRSASDSMKDLFAGDARFNVTEGFGGSAQSFPGGVGNATLPPSSTSRCS